MFHFFDINNTFFTLWGYAMSYLEFWGTITGIIAVWLSAKANAWSWIIGLLNVSLSFFLFFQIQLYPDMFLQVFFFVTNIMGWLQWKYPKMAEANLKNELKISYLNKQQIIFWTLCGLLGTILMGSFSAKLHEWFSMFFSKPSAFPYLDSFTSVISIIATFLMIRKKIECWILWILIDVISTYMYFLKDVKLYSLLYFVFCFMALLGFLNWEKEYR